MAGIDIENNVLCVCGGGHQGLSMAAHLALSGQKVTLWNRTYSHIHGVAESKEVVCNGVVKGTAHILKASDKIEEVVSKIILVVTPSSAHKDVAIHLAPFVDRDTVIVLNPGRTFGAIEFAETLKAWGVRELPHIAETQTIVYTCRRDGENSATIFALKDDVPISSLQRLDLGYILNRLPECLRCHLHPVESVAVTSLSNVGMVLHCAPVLMNIGWIESKQADFKYYYDGISESVARYLEHIDRERLTVSATMGIPVESLVAWLKRTYGANGDSIFEAIRTTTAYKKIDAPASVNCRYITEDVPNGLVPMESLGQQLGVQTPYMTDTINLANAVMECNYRISGRNYSLQLLKRYF